MSGLTPPAATSSTGRAKAPLRLLSKLAAAVSAQLSQALASFFLQVAAARILGVAGLGTFALLYGAIVVATALCTGLVGDSLTVLDRSEPSIRSGLQTWCALAAGTSGLLGAVIASATGLLTPGAAILFGLATAVFVVEDALRRMLMAVVRFWSLPLVDGTSLIVSIFVLLGASWAGWRLTVGTFMLALLVGQVVASAAAIVRLPPAERHLGPLRRAGQVGPVFKFGVWRSASQMVRPATLTVVRSVITAIVGAAIYGQLEAARVFMAPALLLVNGIGSFLLPTYVKRKDDGAHALTRRADLAAGWLLISSLVMGFVAVGALPIVGGLITGGKFAISSLAVFGWAVYAASCAAVTPYGSLAAVLGAPSRIMPYRMYEAMLSVGAVAAVMANPISVNWAPLAMACGPFVGGLGIRQFVLLPIIRSNGPRSGGARRVRGKHALKAGQFSPIEAGQSGRQAARSERAPALTTNQYGGNMSRGNAGRAGLRRFGRLGIGVLGIAVLGFGIAPVVQASADTAPAAGSGLPATVSADALPTVQINGVVWSSVTVGNVTYATGNFTKARPAGSALGVNEINRGGILAFDVTTGNLITSFNHSLNGAGRIILASPDQSTIYVGGDFTTVDGISHSHIAAFNVASGALSSSFSPTVNGTVLGLAATNTTAYVGGSFTTANGATRTNVAAFASANGALTGWNPVPAGGSVTALAQSADRVVIAGRFNQLDGASRYGIGAVDLTTGGLMSWNSSFPIQDAGTAASLTSMTSYNGQILATGYVFGAGGNFEGEAEFDAAGNLSWLNSCHGDNYSIFGVNGVVYSAGHAHDCSDVGTWEDTNPRTWHRALATVDHATCTEQANNNANYANFAGLPCATQLDWYPDFAVGTFTGASQGPWSVSGNTNYVVYGGEFPSVNGVAQQGLTRFAVRALAPNKQGPIANTKLVPNAVSYKANTARVSWGTTYDRDNQYLTYNLYRSGTTAPIYTVTQPSTFWNLPNLSYNDTGLTIGGSYRYRITVSDPLGNTISVAQGPAVTISNGAAVSSAYAQDVLNAGASDYWRLDQANGATIDYDYAGTNDLTVGAGVTGAAGGAIANDANAASTFNGTATGLAATANPIPGPNVFTESAWFSTTTTAGGKILGFGNANTGTSTNYDRHVYMDAAGHINFGVYTGASVVITSPGTYNDGAYHQVVASMSGAGMVLYIDGKLIGTNTGTTAGQSYNGYWRVGGDTSWSGASFFSGTIDDVAIYPTALSGAQIRQQYVDSGRTLVGGTAPADNYGKTVWNDSPSLYYRLDDTAGTTAVDSSGNLNNGIYSGGVTFGTASPVSGGSGTAVTFNGSTGTVASTQLVNNPSVYSEELWFNTTSGSGGKLIGFGTRQTGLSTSYDRQVYMLASGQLVFGTYTGQLNLATSVKSYNDGTWHQVVATQAADGMTLYVDGKSVATNAQTSAQAYSGYWRVGGDNISGWGANNGFFAGAIDEAAVYAAELTPAQVLAHYKASPAAANVAPVASFTSTPTNLSVAFNAGASTDPDGSVASYAWSFGDGTTGTGVNPTHVYPAASTYTVTLTVTDNQGATNAVTQTVTTTPAPNVPPTASFTVAATALSVAFDASGSTDADGSIASYAWSFGDGTTGTGATLTHVYAVPGAYPVTLTVTDNQGASTALTQTVTVSAANVAPVASFTSTPTSLSVAFDGTGSTDSDGSIASYAWSFGDGTTGSGATPTHAYPAAGTYTVTLTVTDNQGATNAATQSVTLSGPTVLASDDFGRTVASGWGSADSGAAWTASTASAFSVGGGTGNAVLTAAGSLRSAYLNTLSSDDTDARVSFSLDKASTAGGYYVTLVGRRIVNVGDYRAKVHVLSTGVVRVTITRANATGVETVLVAETTVAGLTYNPGDVLTLRVSVTGTASTSIQAKVWSAASVEPAAWQISTTDTTAGLGTAGSVGVIGYLSGTSTNAPVTVSFDTLRVYKASTL